MLNMSLHHSQFTACIHTQTTYTLRALCINFLPFHSFTHSCLYPHTHINTHTFAHTFCCFLSLTLHILCTPFNHHQRTTMIYSIVTKKKISLLPNVEWISSLLSSSFSTRRVKKLQFEIYWKIYIKINKKRVWYPMCLDSVWLFDTWEALTRKYS